MSVDSDFDSSAPDLIWDGFGLQSLHSGVGFHAWSLHSELKLLGQTPRILASTPHINKVFYPWLCSNRWPLSRIKPWSLYVAGEGLKDLMRQEPRKTIFFHGLSNYNIPPVNSKQLRKVLTLHDLIPLMAPGLVSFALRQYLSWQMPRAIQGADAIICVSQWTEASLLERFPAAKGRTIVIPNGFPRVAQKPRRESLPERMSLLTIARHENYKRLALIPAILELLPSTARWTVVTDELGVKLLHEIAPSMSRLQVFTGIKEEFLQDLHQQASLYVHPSLWEGFCLPAAASLSHSIPVLYTAGSGLDEVVGDGGLGLSKAAGSNEWAMSIQTLHGSIDYFAKAASQNYRSASWSEVAARTLELYAKLK